MHDSTLTSLAILKVNIDHGRDYLDYLRPFVLDILAHENLDIIKAEKIHELLLKKFGLNIPDRSIQVVLKRLSKQHPLKKESGVYKVTGALKVNTDITAKKNKAKRHITAIISGLREFSRSTVRHVDSDEKAIKALLDFLSKFNIPCLKAYLRDTAIPNIEQSYTGDIVLVSKYVTELQKTDPGRFESFMVLVQGHMLANALTCPDLDQVPDTYKGVTFYLDTPLLVQLLELDSEYKHLSIKNLIQLLIRLKGKVAVFSHSRDELKRTIQSSAEYIDKPSGKGSIVREARRTGKTKSDLLLLVQHIDNHFSNFHIQVENTPGYEPDKYRFQIDESKLDSMLETEVSYRNPEARKYDRTSVRSIYVLRKGMAPDTVERAKAVLVTSNTKFAKVAWEYGQKYDELKQVSSVITSFSLANMAWLKAPMGASSLPETEVLAFSYSALRPSRELLHKFLTEIENLEKNNQITERDHQLLRSHLPVEKELMDHTMGDEKALSEETITETLQRVKSEIKQEESEKLTKEQEQHKMTRRKLTEERQEKQKIKEKLHWRCAKKANLYSWIITTLLIILQFLLIFSTGFKFSLLYVGILSLFIVTLNIFGLTHWKIQKIIKESLLKCFLKKEGTRTGLDYNQNKG